MKSVTVTYHAPPGDSKVAEVFGHTFFDGKSETIEVDDHVAEKLRGNKHFECSEPKDAQPKKPDPKQQKADEEAAKRADEEKKAAQMPNPTQRGAVLNKEEKEEPEAKASEPPKGDPPKAAPAPQHK